MTDFRAVPRYALALPITVHVAELRHAGTTLDISTRGLCFWLEVAPDPGSALDFTVALSAALELTHAHHEAFIHGRAKVCRVVDCGQRRFRIAASIERYKISRHRAHRSESS